MKTIINTIILFILLAIPIISSARGLSCADIEFAELQSMSQEELIEEYCQTSGRAYLNLVSSLSGNKEVFPNFESCKNLLNKITRIYLRRFNTESIETLKTKCPNEIKK